MPDFGADFDPVTKPKHYASHPSGVECKDLNLLLDYPRGCALKYVWRHDGKNAPREDLRKALWYANEARDLWNDGYLQIVTPARGVASLVKFAVAETSKFVRETVVAIYTGELLQAIVNIEEEIDRLDCGGD